MVSQLEPVLKKDPITPTAKQDLWQAIQTVIRWQNQAPPLVPVSRQDPLPLSFSQERLWFLQQLEPAKAAAYNMAFAFRITGSLNSQILENSLNVILQRHEALRTTFHEQAGKPVQSIHPPVAFPLKVIDLQQLPAQQRETKAMQLVTADIGQPFDLQEVPLIRGTLIQLESESLVLVLIVHHIAVDAWSKGVLFEELAALYQASPLPELPLQYADFAVWQRQWLQDEFLQLLLDYWKRQLGANLEPLQLPIDRVRPALPSRRSAMQKLGLPQELSEALKTLSRGEKVTLFVTLLAAFKVLLHHYTEQDRLFVCTPTANRNRKDIKRVMGYFVNLLILKTDVSGNPSFRELLGRVSQVASGGYAHQDLPVQQLLQSLNLLQAPLSQVMFALQNTAIHHLDLPGLQVQNLDVDAGTADFDLYLYLIEEAGVLTAVLKYNTDLFAETSIALMLQHFQTILEQIVIDPDRSIASLLPLSESDRQQLREKRSKPLDSAPESVYIAPRNDLELKLTQIWSEVLDIPLVGIKDNFFELGGHSLLAMTLFARIAETFDRTLPLTTLLQAPTIEQLAQFLDQAATPFTSLVPIQPKGDKPPFFCVHGQQGSVLNLRELAHYLGSEQPFYGLQARGLDGLQAPYSRIQDMAAHYIQEIRTIQLEGPYFLGGNSMGGIVAFEMAQQLQQQGQSVAALVMFDTFGRGSFPRLSFRQQHYRAYLWQLGLSKTLLQEVRQLLHRKIQSVIGRLYLSLGRTVPATLARALVAEANMQAKKAYHPQIYSGQITLFRASEPSTFTKLYLPTPQDWENRDPQHGWNGLASDGLAIHDIPGDHFSLFQEPHVQTLAKKLQQIIQSIKT
jgi:thioesterase domain-containing protein/acyl carrier protein